MSTPTATATHTTRPRKGSASTRRHHHRRLPHRLRQLLPDAQTILTTPVSWFGDNGRPAARYVLVAYDTSGNRIPHTPGTIDRVVDLLQGAFPTADWTTAQTWHANGNHLTAWNGATTQRHRPTSVEQLSDLARHVAQTARPNRSDEWTPSRVLRAVPEITATAPNSSVARTRARRILQELNRAGLFIKRDTDGRRCYIPSPHLDGAR
ncbi:hypothetical protein F0L17_14170 [Streptomyces sp. TRM43335]|uniref:Uncharacterized protein n=1 Tax=Streptomyces taklimakanensis TaxID=2569853 RepID=A0A6G2BDU6_9ACTN|nr:hypothetical protein [Streptomyces taklimakanensis]MTE20233.1 hypothetical protein [Streptomyces taklimakanensis]